MKLLRTIAILIASLTMVMPFAHAQRSGGGGRGSSCTADFFVNELGTLNLSITANATRLWTMEFDCTRTFTKVTYMAFTADATANLYSFGWVDPTGKLVCNVAPTAGTVFAPSVNAIVTLSTTSTCTLSAGVRYAFAITGNASTAAIYSTLRRFLPQNGAAPLTGNTTAGGALNSTMTYAADVYVNNQGQPWLSLHN